MACLCTCLKKTYAMNRYLLPFLLLMAVVGLGAAFIAVPSMSKKRHPSIVPQSHVRIRRVTIPVEVRRDDRGRAEGLSGRSSLGTNDGMLFLFPRKDRYSFWMKEMRFSLDFVWISEKKVVAIHEHVLPPPPLSTFAPPTPVDAVLEVNAGFIERHGIHIGDPVEMVFDKNIRIE